MLIKANSWLLGARARTWGKFPRLKEYAYRMAFVFLLKPLREASGKRRRLTNCLITYRFKRWKTGMKSVNLAVRYAGASKGWPSLKTSTRKSRDFSPGLVKKIPMRFDPAQPQRIYRQPPLQANMIRI